MAGFLIQEAEHYGSLCAKDSILIVNRLFYGKLGKRGRLDSGLSGNGISHLRGELILAFHRHYGNSNTVGLASLDRIAHFFHHHIPRALEKAHVVGVMDYAHLVGFVIADREGCPEYQHVLFVFQLLELGVDTFYLREGVGLLLLFVLYHGSRGVGHKAGIAEFGPY